MPLSQTFWNSHRKSKLCHALFSIKVLKCLEQVICPIGLLYILSSTLYFATKGAFIILPQEQHRPINQLLLKATLSYMSNQTEGHRGWRL
uniref:Uncharacterized protein n=1 Tax=Anguilla anguilla TaxID=7936 RepID=A0A0E9R577_ANGAN